jgi:hypothetical protein
MSDPEYVVETVSVGQSDAVATYLASKPASWQLVQWRWTYLPDTDDRGNFNAVEATWRVT